MRLICLATSLALVVSPLQAQEDTNIDMARLCVGTVKHVEELGAVALAYGQQNGLAEQIFRTLDQKNADMADMLSIAGGRYAVALLTNADIGLESMRIKASDCAFTSQCDTSLMQEATVFAEYIAEACRRDATNGS